MNAELLSSITAKALELRALRNENAWILGKIQNLLDNKSQKKLYLLKIKRNKCKARVKALKERILSLQHSVNKGVSEKEELTKRNGERRILLSKARQQLSSKMTEFSYSSDEMIRDIREKCANSFQKLSEYRKYLVAELLSFFPLNPISEEEYCIVNINLPNNSYSWFALSSTEEVATALGYIVHILLIVAFYLDICLPYRMHFGGSRSTIWREGSSKKYVLFNNAVSAVGACSSEEFRIGLEMLNWNIVHLCLLAGRVVVSEHQIDHSLPNLLAALRSHLLGSDIRTVICTDDRKTKASTHFLSFSSSISSSKSRTRTNSLSSLPIPSLIPSSLMTTSKSDSIKEDFMDSSLGMVGTDRDKDVLTTGATNSNIELPMISGDIRKGHEKEETTSTISDRDFVVTSTDSFQSVEETNRQQQTEEQEENEEEDFVVIAAEKTASMR